MQAREEIEVAAATVRGRSILSVPEGPGPFSLMVGFHGYAESAEIQLARLRAVPRSENLALLSIQGLHWFYTRSGEVVAGWMTRLHREEAIADNLAWVSSALASAARRMPWNGEVIWTGFSQGAAMAYRAAAFLEPRCTALIVLGGDVPPDVADRGTQAAGPLSPLLVGRGHSDELYPRATFERDKVTLEGQGVDFTALEFAGGHEWNGEFALGVASFLDRQRTSP